MPAEKKPSLTSGKSLQTTASRNSGRDKPAATASKRVAVDLQKKRLLELLKQGYTVADAEKAIGLKPGIYKYYRKSDKDFALSADVILHRRDVEHATADKPIMDFPAFSEKYLKQRLFRHQLQWIDLLEGNDPRELHSSQRYEKGDPNFVIINTPPEHAKSTTITMNYLTYRICKDPGVRVIVVSKTQGMAKKFLHGIKQRLTSQRYADLIRDFAPTDGFDGPQAVWRADQIYVPFESAEGTAEKDPTVEAIGIGGQIYGARADLIILDDCVTLDNVGQVEDQIEWIQQEVMSRLGAFGRLIVVGTRVGPVDLYTELMNPKRYPSEKSSWTYLSQPAVLEIREHPEDWVTLWPRSNQPMKGDLSAKPDADGLVPFWTGPLMHRIRERIQPRTWSMVYMQQQVDDEAVFPAADVQGCVNGTRYPGTLHPTLEGGTVGGPMDKGAEWYMIAGMDPATVSGFTAVTVYAFNRKTHKRRVVDVSNKRMTPDAIINIIKDWTVKYDVDEWRIEKNAFQAFLTQSKEITQYLASRGVLLREHATYKNKHDPGFGVAAMAMLFRGWQDKNNMIELPRKEGEGVKAMIEQLVTWAPDAPKSQKTDVVMSLWFCELRAKELVAQTGSNHYSDDTTWLSEDDKEQRVVLDIDEYLARQREDQARTFWAV